VETGWIELAAHHAVIETSLLLTQEREFSARRPGIGRFAQNSEAETALVRELTAHVFEISAVLRVLQTWDPLINGLCWLVGSDLQPGINLTADFRLRLSFHTFSAHH
jgi:hypothetical protein